MEHQIAFFLIASHSKVVINISMKFIIYGVVHGVYKNEDLC